MKKEKMVLTETRTNQVFNELGILHECGEYAGYYQEEAYKALGLENELEIDEWCDIMSDDKGNQYAIFAEGELTSDSFCEYRKLEDDEKVNDVRGF
jgi:hypothetical protein